MSKFLNEGGYGCIYYPGIKCDGNPQLKKKVVSKLQKHNESADNEINIGNRVKAIANFQLFFLPVISSCPVNLNKINSKLLTACSNITDADIEHDNIKTAKGKNDGYILLEVSYVLNRSFYNILIDMYSSKKHIIIGIIENYSYLLESLKTLLEEKIVHFDIKSNNILYNQLTNLPLVLDFGLSIYMPELTGKNMKHFFYNYTPDYYIWPLEVHVINFLLHEGEAGNDRGLTEEQAKRIAADFVKQNKGLSNYSDKFIQDYKAACVTYLQTYIGKDKKKSIDKLLSFYHTWDNYSLSILYLKTMKFMFPQGFHKNSLILYFSQLLLYNIHPNPEKRYSLAETTKKFNDIFFLEENVDNYVDFIDTFAYDPELTTRAIQADINQLNNTKANMLKANKDMLKANKDMLKANKDMLKANKDMR